MIDAVSGSSAVFQRPGRTQRRGTEEESSAGTNSTDTDTAQVIQRLRTIDQRVRTHEQAHVAAGGPHAGSPSYQFTRGPDGKNYAVAGEVPIDASPERDPQATIRKMEIVKRAALAPADPSPQDMRVAAQADAQAAQAQAELRRQQSEEGAGDGRPGQEASSGTSGNDGPAARGAAAYSVAAAIGGSLRGGGLSLFA